MASLSRPALFASAFPAMLILLVSGAASAMDVPKLSALSLRGHAVLSEAELGVEKRELGAEPEWPCCRQYDSPPEETVEAEVTGEVGGHSSGHAYVPAPPGLVHVETVPYHITHPHHARAPASPPASVEKGVAGEMDVDPNSCCVPPEEEKVELKHRKGGPAPAPRGAAGLNAEPEWPCCRNYGH